MVNNRSTLTLVNYQFSYKLRGNVSQPKVLLLHGFMGCQDEFDALIDECDEQLCCLIVDLPGHGQTKVLDSETTYTEAAYTMDAVAEGLFELLHRLDFFPCHLMGYSMGGRLALYLVCRFQKQFQSVLLESASPGLATKAEQVQRQHHDEQLAIILEQGSWPSFLEQWYQQSLFTSLHQHPDFDQLMYQRAQNCPQQLSKILRGSGTGKQPSLWDNLRYIDIPTHLVVGSLDSKFVSINHQIVRYCQDAQLTLVPNCGHNVHFERPQSLAKILTTHIAAAS